MNPKPYTFLTKTLARPNQVSGMLKYWWDDLCCQGCSRERLHVHAVVDIFPSVWRCPFKDGWHGAHLVTSTFNSGTSEVDVFAREVGQTLRRPN